MICFVNKFFKFKIIPGLKNAKVGLSNAVSTVSVAIFNPAKPEGRFRANASARAPRARVARARAREGAARSRKIFARFHFLHISVACARDARSRAGIARERARSRGARARCASARRKILRDRPSANKCPPRILTTNF